MLSVAQVGGCGRVVHGRSLAIEISERRRGILGVSLDLLGLLGHTSTHRVVDAHGSHLWGAMGGHMNRCSERRGATLRRVGTRTGRGIIQNALQNSLSNLLFR